MEVLGSRISNVPFWIGNGDDGPDVKYETTFQEHFKYLETTLPKRETRAPPVSPNFHHRDLKRIREHQTETSSSFPPHQPVPVIQPKQTHATMHSTNFKVHSDSKSETFRTTTTEDFQHLPTSVTKPVLPITSVWTNLPKDKYPQPTYRSCYITHEVPPVLKAKPMENTGVGSTLTEDKNSKFVISSYNEQFQNRWCPTLPPLQSVEQISHTSFPVHVKGANLRTLSNVDFGRPGLPVTFYSTTSHEQFSPKEIVRPRPHTYPSSHMLFEQGCTELYSILPSRIKRFSPS
ncbi:hypothetical protein E1301_Tti009651 [Triplophysa tibetana]|uniref:Uncharacterized protein n=1 Tax=Triplophysa tibetana TaxID=1572043 RepID=A0A5A9NGB5_9TELE|nr:hypothetical protein E1301_Tti009651 [Triplophysa tibetana]